MSRVLLDIVAQNFSGGICRLPKSVAGSNPASFFRSKPCLTRPAINRSKTGCIAVATCRVAASNGIFGATPISRSPRANCAAANHHAQSAASSSEYRERLRHGPMRFEPRLAIEPRERRQSRFGPLVRHPFPGDMIRQIAVPPGAGAARAGKADGSESVHQNTWFSFLIV